jgi:hypothetical protein
MEIRLQLKTHYQIAKPGIFSVLLSKCTSPSQSNYQEVISERLANIGFKKIALNKESAKFAVAMAQSFGFITSNMFWGWRGHAINILLEDTQREKIDDFLDLTAAEKILFLKYYLEADGATILEICKKLSSKGKISRNELLSTDFIDQIFINIWETYRQLTTDLSQKTHLRQNIQKLRSKPYTFKTRIHKALAHVEPLADFDVIERKEHKNEIIFLPKTNRGLSPMDKLTQAMNTIKTMEWRFSKFQHFEIISNVYNLKPVAYDPEIYSELLREEIVKTYLKARTEPTKMASIATISDVISAKILSDKGILVERPHIEKELDRLKLEYPSDIHYHVDMGGRKAFIVLGNGIYNDTPYIYKKSG